MHTLQEGIVICQCDRALPTYSVQTSAGRFVCTRVDGEVRLLGPPD